MTTSGMQNKMGGTKETLEESMKASDHAGLGKVSCARILVGLEWYETNLLSICQAECKQVVHCPTRFGNKIHRQSPDYHYYY